MALPTYGYRVVFDAQGKFLRLTAEGGRRTGDGAQERLTLADSAAMAQVVRELTAERPATCAGLVWFRLPIATDRLNWPWPALRAVMRGEEPETRIEAEVRMPQAGLAEVWLSNKGETNPLQPVRVKIDMGNVSVVASDILPDYAQGEAGAIQGPAPRVGEERMAAWFRLGDGETSASLRLGKVEWEQ